MPIRKTTIKAKIGKALEQLEKNRVDAAKNTLAALDARIDGADATKRKPGKYALFVKSNYAKVKRENPNLDAPAIMKQIAANWRASSASS